MNLSSKKMAELICGIRGAYARGENAMDFAREALKAENSEDRNHRLATLLAYDLQAGTYVDQARKRPAQIQRWCCQLAALIAPVLPSGGSLLELGVGEATTLAGVLAELKSDESQSTRAYGFDISWSRVNVANDWLREQSQTAELFVADLMNIPLADNSIDLVYSAHSLEPNGGRERAAIAECLRVARHEVILIEPCYELASTEAQARMRRHGYVRGLRETAEHLGAEVVEHRLLDYTINPLNPSGVLRLRKKKSNGENNFLDSNEPTWQCPLSATQLERTKEAYFTAEFGLIYPVLGSVPLLRSEHAIVASKYPEKNC